MNRRNLVLALVLVSATFSMPAYAGFQGLGDLSGGDVYSWVNEVSADGSTVVGYSSSGSGFEAYRWTSSTGMVGLVCVPGRPSFQPGACRFGRWSGGWWIQQFHFMVWNQRSGVSMDASRWHGPARLSAGRKSTQCSP